jgi:hypothetical protein
VRAPLRAGEALLSDWDRDVVKNVGRIGRNMFVNSIRIAAADARSPARARRINKSVGQQRCGAQCCRFGE